MIIKMHAQCDWSRSVLYYSVITPCAADDGDEYKHYYVHMCLKYNVCIQVVCLSPTYELALQTGQVAEKMGQFCPEIKIGYAVRGERGRKCSPKFNLFHLCHQPQSISNN